MEENLLARHLFFAVLLLPIFIAAHLLAPTTVQEREASLKQHFELRDSSIFKNLQWRNIGPYFMGGRISDIEAYEKNPHTFLVAAASGGLWITRNNATTWEPIFDKESSITIGDFAISQTDEKLIWVGTGESNNYGNASPGTGVFKSIDGGKTWKNMGLVDTHHIGRILVNPRDNNIVYVAALGHMYTHNQQRGVFKTTDGGKTVQVTPMQEALKNKSTAPSGKDIVHIDHHAMWIDPNNPGRIILGNDGGVNISYDEGNTWKKINNLPIPQCYTISYDNRDPYYIYTGLQDNGVNVGRSNFKYGESSNPWEMIISGDGNFVQPEPGNPEVVYAKCQYGHLFRIDRKAGIHQNIRPQSKDRNNKYRFHFFAPFIISYHNPYTLYMGANKILKSVDRGYNWIELSPDLTKKKYIKENPRYSTITALDESPLTPQILYAGTNGGNAWVSLQGGSQWQDISNRLPVKKVTRMKASKYKKKRVYVTLNGFREGDYKTYVFVSEDNGKNWTSIKGNLPDEPVHVIREDPEKENILYLGTDLTIYVSLDRGKTWHSLKANLPTNPVMDLQIHPREKELIIGTHGRGVYIVPIEEIRKLTPD
ncbi:MAG: hypothetical protein GTO45_03230 [Candidatus Aminicenantes bacterium]|nr:hypothetical protein [Candidatus Aminicenantes bacterium]NIM77739.1 hypothetical protein [Candidatus Aminicenantes bacterium]NIN17052.1 hypothetical protein [Candidatus Aminicenantes bacterium]NIN40945.1 hypothetical protein [Candidatus Aminicenantes bacterium]NIN83750.1 hypothetical protein [Candidatus Aminicenantes bacterium]